MAGKHRLSKAASKPARRRRYAADAESVGLFTQFAIELAAQRPGRTLTILLAGCTTAGNDLSLETLRLHGYQVDASLIDDLTPQAERAVAARPELRPATLAELRTVPLRPRSFDVVQCTLLLHRITNADVVLSRLAEAVRPGGLLLLRIADPASATGFLDRRLPAPVRVLAWRSSRPGQPGPYPAIYEPVASARGIELFMSRHGLSIAYRCAKRATDNRGRHDVGDKAVRLVAWLSHGRLPADHDELCYVVRKPEDRFARVLP